MNAPCCVVHRHVELKLAGDIFIIII